MDATILFALALMGAEVTPVVAIGGVAASLLTATAGLIVSIQNRRIAREEAYAARMAAQSGEDETYVNTSLAAMREAQGFLSQENVTLRATIEAQRAEISDLHSEIKELRNHLMSARTKLAECQSICAEVSARLNLLERKDPQA